MNEKFRNPFPTVDIIIEIAGGIVWIERKNPPPGWAMPGGFVDYGESVERAVEFVYDEAGQITGAAVVVTGTKPQPSA